MSDLPPATVPLTYEPVWYRAKVRPSARQLAIAIALLLVTLFTTTVIGVRLNYNYSHSMAPLSAGEPSLPWFPVHWAFSSLGRLATGLPFALSLMGILLAHELGHYVYCLRYRVHATPPYFIPAPTLIGTMGAFIMIRSTFPSRRSLFDIGIAGPIAGFVVALPVVVAGMLLSYPIATVPQANVTIGYPLLMRALHGLFVMLHLQPHVSISHIVLHPLAISGWTGMFATSLNLLPAGQLDGGHIVFSWSPRAHRVISWLAIVALLPMAFYKWVGWAVWAVVLYITGMRHPIVERDDELNAGRKWLALFAVFMLAVSIIPAPVVDSGIIHISKDVEEAGRDLWHIFVRFLGK